MLAVFRVAYVRPATNDVPFVSSRVFFPVRQSLRVSESISMLIVRINNWLAQVGGSHRLAREFTGDATERFSFQAETF